ncbi:MAG: SDR family oxidoreductase, partial [Frankia sp.]|nr:SDR family oxidoreductase [Frankia sp.]
GGMSWGPFDLTGRAAIVTGAARGIGFACASRLREAGAHVLVADLDEEGANKAVAELELVIAPGKIAAFAGDIAVPADIDRMVACCVTAFGAVDILVNNAAIYPAAPFESVTAEFIQRVLRVNVEGLILTTQAVARQMKAQGRGGAIVNIGSMGAVRGAHPGLVVYGASKGAVTSFTIRAAAALAADGIRVNAIAPGAIETDSGAAMRAATEASDKQAAAALAGANSRIPLGRFGRPDDVATVAVFLASDAAGFVTGTTLPVDGGWLTV